MRSKQVLEKILNLGRKIIPRRLFRLGQPFYHFFLAVTGNIIYRFPGRKLVCIGITGTNGKSTTVELVNSILKTVGHKTGMISTVAFEIAGERKTNTTSRTTLGRWQTQRLLRKMIKAGCKYAVIEVASEGIAWYRTWGIPFDVAVFTNLSQEHLNFHKNMTNYRNTKGKLFASLSLARVKKLKAKSKKDKINKVSIVNADDREAKYFSAFPADENLSYGVKRGAVRAENIQTTKDLSFVINYQGKNYPINSKLFASFNVYNILAAWCVGFSQKIDPKKIKEGIEAIASVPGRMQEVPNKRGIRVFVDYAMTPDSYELLYKEMRRFTSGKLITVFGAAGDRDKSKRPLIGEVAAKMTDYTILTDDEPYSEDPKKIIAEIENGFKKVKNTGYEIVYDRKKALKKAIEMATPGDTIVIPGMGNEQFRNIGGSKKIPWNEAEILEGLLR